MFRSILVPLDGSAMAEQAAIPAGEIARRLDAGLSLVVVHPSGPPEDAPFPGSSADRQLRMSEDGYLHLLAERIKTFGVRTRLAVLSGNTGDALAEFARTEQVDLVVASTRGRGAIGRLVRGGIALRLSHSLYCPMLLLKPLQANATVLPAEGVHRILVPLDGSAAAELSLEPALALAAARQVSVMLVQVVSPAQEEGRTLQELKHEAQGYLTRVADRLDRRGILVDQRVVARRSPAAAIAETAERWGADLIALTTRDRGEGERLLLGSVADTLVRRARVPVLVCHTQRRTVMTRAMPLDGALVIA
jgi:nucleotide-binding universal stress UspA family protein